LRLLDKATGAELFRRPVPALTHIWISPDSAYVVGISNVMLWNPYQLVVFSRSGDRLLERNMVGVNWPGVSQTGSIGTNNPCRKLTSLEMGQPPHSLSKILLGSFVNFSFLLVIDTAGPNVVTRLHFKADLTLGLGSVAFDYLAK
jgi:hypothetical protein